MPLTITDIRRYVRLKLGGERVRVELSEKEIDEASQEALNVYNRWMPLRRFIKIQLINGKAAYELDKDVIGVYRIDFVHKDTSLAVVEDIFHRRYYEPVHDMDAYARYLSYIDMLKRVLSIEPEADFQPPEKEGEAPNLYVHAPHQASQILLMAVAFVRRPMHKVPIMHHDWINRYTTAWCKEVLGRIRGKFSNVPAPGGGQNLDAAQLLGESVTEFQNLENEIKSWQTLPPPMWG